jgi:hypothetical protein
MHSENNLCSIRAKSPLRYPFKSLEKLRKLHIITGEHGQRITTCVIIRQYHNKPFDIIMIKSFFVTKTHELAVDHVS